MTLEELLAIPGIEEGHVMTLVGLLLHKAGYTPDKLDILGTLTMTVGVGEQLYKPVDRVEVSFKLPEDRAFLDDAIAKHRLKYGEVSGRVYSDDKVDAMGYVFSNPKTPNGVVIPYTPDENKLSRVERAKKWLGL